MPLTVRLEPEIERKLKQLAHRRRKSVSDLVREGIDHITAEEPPAPYDLIAHLIGVARGGPEDLSERTGQRFRELLRRKKSRR